MKKPNLDNMNLTAVSNGLKVLGLVVAGAAYVINHRLEERQLEEKIDEALEARGFDALLPVNQ